MEIIPAFYSQICNLDCPKGSYGKTATFATMFTLNMELQTSQFELGDTACMTSSFKI